jgi:hypothetical protein
MSWDPWVMWRAQREMGNQAAGTRERKGLTAIDCSVAGGWGDVEMTEAEFFSG